MAASQNRTAAELVLASASPRRRELLQAAGVAFEIIPADIVEERQASEAPLAFASRRADHPITLGGSKLAASAGGGTPALLMRSEHESVCSISSTYNPPRRPRRASE